MRGLLGFLSGFGMVVVMAIAMEAAHAQAEPPIDAYTTADLLSAALYGVAAILFALGYSAGKQR